MIDVPASSDAPGSGAASQRTEDRQLKELQKLLFGGDPAAELANLKAEVIDPRKLAPRVSNVLPEAISQRPAEDAQMAAAISPFVIESIKQTSRNEPEKISEAIFPVLGPAIRKAIAQAFANLTQTINQTLQHSFSARGMRWRFEALASGKSFAEVVLYHSLVYRVEQVFLIHRQTGLALAHVAADSVQTQDAELVSGMLTAIQDFIKDSFGAGQSEGVESLQLGDVSVIAEQGPRAVLACVVRGTLPGDFRNGMAATLEQIHRQFGSPLEIFHGDTLPFVATRPLLEAHLESRYQRFAEPGARPKAAIALFAVLLLLLAVSGIFFIRWQLKWKNLVSRISSTPGIVVTRAENSLFHPTLAGLRDPLTSDPISIANEAGYAPGKIEMRWEEFASPSLAAERAKKLLHPPAGVTLTLRNGILTASGPVSPQWSSDAQKLAPFIPGINSFQVDDLATLETLARELESVTIHFADTSIELTPGQEKLFEDAGDHIARIDSIAEKIGRKVKVTIAGHTDKTGTKDINRDLSVDRARKVSELVRSRAGKVRVTEFITIGKADSEPVSTDLLRNRRVTFKVESIG